MTWGPIKVLLGSNKNPSWFPFITPQKNFFFISPLEDLLFDPESDENIKSINRVKVKSYFLTWEPP